MDDQPLGTVLRDGERRGLRYVRRLAHAPEKVWRALTESEHLRAWLPCDMVGAREQGASIVLPFWPDVVEKYEIEEPAIAGTIRVWDPPRVFEWTWGGDVLRWELEPEGMGTVLTLTTWLADADPASLRNTAAGYHVCLDHLATLLATGSAPSVADTDPSKVEARYSDVVR